MGRMSYNYRVMRCIDRWTDRYRVMRGFFGDRCEAQVHSFMDDIQIVKRRIFSGRTLSKLYDPWS